MKFLLVAKQEKNAAAFLDALRCLIERGHSVTLSIQERDETRDQRLRQQIPSDRFAVVPCPPARLDEWTPIAPLVRRLRDCLQYARPEWASAAALQTRIASKLRQELGAEGDSEAIAPLFDEFLASQQPDVLLVSPLVHFGSAQADLAASARRLGIPLWMLLFSWDNLSTKGCLHEEPDLMFVWNEQQRAEAARLHGYPTDRVVVVGAPRFDRFFDLRPALERQEFHAPLGLDAGRATLLYLCSSRLIAPNELEFIRRWLTTIRRSGVAALRAANVIVRPHPDVDLLGENGRYERQRWTDLPALDSAVARPFNDAHAVVLRTSVRDPEGLYESLVHSTAVVGLNTTAELEAGIVGRPVFTIASGDSQQATLHFHYLTPEHGGFVSVAESLDDHVRQLAATLDRAIDPAPIRTFVESFLRPHGVSRAVSPLLAETLEQHASAPRGKRVAVADAPPPEPELDARAARNVLPLAYKRARLVVQASPAALRYAVDGAIPLDPRAVDWLEASVGIGDVVYEVQAGLGAYALLAARQRGAVVVAFEAGYQAFASLCDNVLLNGSQASIIPVPLALAEGSGCADLKYERDYPGGERYSVRLTPWRLRPDAGVRPYVQPACVSTLDATIEHYRLPAPTHLRLARQADALAVLKGAARTLEGGTLRSIWARVAPDQEEEVTAVVAKCGLRQTTRTTRASSVQVVFERAAAVGAVDVRAAGNGRS